MEQSKGVPFWNGRFFLFFSFLWFPFVLLRWPKYSFRPWKGYFVFVVYSRTFWDPLYPEYRQRAKASANLSKVQFSNYIVGKIENYSPILANFAVLKKYRSTTIIEWLSLISFYNLLKFSKSLLLEFLGLWKFPFQSYTQGSKQPNFLACSPGVKCPFALV